jgi:hypothetical protein
MDTPSPQQQANYVLRGGEAGAKRLRLLARVKWPTTRELFQGVGLRRTPTPGICSP